MEIDVVLIYRDGAKNTGDTWVSQWGGGKTHLLFFPGDKHPWELYKKN